MIFDNRDNILKLNKRRYILVLIYIPLMAFIIWSGIFEETLKIYLAIAISAIYITYNIISYYINYNYFSFRDDSENLMFRFVSMRPFDSAKKAVQIKITDFAGYKFEKSFFGLKENIILRIKTKKGIANFPPISISALSEKHKQMLKQALNQFV